MHTISRLFAFAAVVLLISVPVFSGDWVKLGTEVVHLEADNDVLAAKNGAAAVSQVKLKVKGATLKINSVTLVFADGTSQQAELGTDVRPGFETEPIAVDGGAKAIKEVQISYRARSSNRSGRASITAYGAP